MTKKSKSRTRSQTMTCVTCKKECPIKPGRLCYECNKKRTEPKYDDPREAWVSEVLKYQPGKGTKRKRRKRVGGRRRTGKRIRFASRRR